MSVCSIFRQIKKTDTDPFNYIFKMLVTWREESQKLKMTENKMLETLLDALKDVERLDVYEEVIYYAGKQTVPPLCISGPVSHEYTCILYDHFIDWSQTFNNPRFTISQDDHTEFDEWTKRFLTTISKPFFFQKKSFSRAHIS